MPSLPAALEEYVTEAYDRHLDELHSFVRFASVSGPAGRPSDSQKCASWLRDHVAKIGLENGQLIETAGNPIVYADWLHAEEHAPCVLLYGHYDVQPAGTVEAWETPPFEPRVRNGRLYGRGSSDNKGQIFLNLKVLETFLAVDGKLPCNVKLVIEGDEEVSQDNLEGFIDANQELLSSDLLLNCDSGMYDDHVVGIATGLRGFVAMEFTVRTATIDAHSGLFGGVAPNAIHALASIVASFHQQQGGVAVRGFYEHVKPIPPAELGAWGRLPFDAEHLKTQLGATRLTGEEGYSELERLWARPTLELHGVTGGFTGDGILAIIPGEASAKLSCRLVPDQDPHEVLQLLRHHLNAHTPPGAAVEITYELAGGPAVATPLNHPAAGAALEALAAAYNTAPVVFRAGWSVPVVEIAKRILGIDALLLGFGLPRDNVHGPNESFELAQYHHGLRAMIFFWPKVAAALRKEPKRVAS